MKCPAQNTKLGKVLRAMHKAGPMTAGEIRRKAGLASDTAVTARIRELRNDYHCDIPPAKPIKQLDGSTLYKYEMKRVPVWIRKELNKERTYWHAGKVAA
ncbi:hypothetical protein [Marinobacter nauticus]|uniref:hypothetical protein n=1 Tax=Marinobacter nauticus TaxID=2743 RepID=UPI001C98F885|nr:hypothetical protein [Marinobacter nauticus]MBY5961918.1 hypothetical protein [Marinobacter nauticus]